jgi:probable F420-dependent oxidoreductase
MKPFRFGACLSYAGSAAEWRDAARTIEGDGYSTLLLPDHFVVPFAPIPALAAAAAATTTLRVGTMVTANDFRNPAVLAKEVATADFLTDGRFELGIGAGWLAAEYDAAGIPFGDAAVRVDRLEEAIAILRGLWADGPFTFEGTHYRIAGLEGTPKPVQRPVPVMIGGGGKRVLTMAAREAQIVSVAPSLVGAGRTARPDMGSYTRTGFEKRIEWIRDAAGERLDELEVSTYFGGRWAITDDRARAADECIQGLRARFGDDVSLTPDDVLASPMFLYGSTDEIADQLVERCERYGLSYLVITEPDIDGFAQVVARLAGT